MSKSIKILSIISVILSCLSITITGSFLTFLWGPINLLFDFPEYVIEEGPIIPVGSILYIIICSVVAVVLFITSKTKKAIAIEIVSIVLLSAVLPFLTYYIDLFQSIWVARIVGSDALNMLTHTSDSLFLSHGVTNLSSALCLITSGMRITEKACLRKQYNSIQMSNDNNI